VSQSKGKRHADSRKKPAARLKKRKEIEVGAGRRRKFPKWARQWEGECSSRLYGTNSIEEERVFSAKKERKPIIFSDKKGGNPIRRLYSRGTGRSRSKDRKVIFLG